MIRFLIIFGIVLALALSMFGGFTAQTGRGLLSPEMRVMTAVSVAVALYVAWRINMVLTRREKREFGEDEPRTGAKAGKLSALFSTGPSASQQARQARVAARRKKLIAEGKLSPDPEPPTDTSNGPAKPDAPTRVSSSASIEEKMAARRERVRRAKEAKGD